MKKVRDASNIDYYQRTRETVSSGGKVYYNLHVNPLVKPKFKPEVVVGSKEYYLWAKNKLGI
jgi:hypothetical protein